MKNDTTNETYVHFLELEDAKKIATIELQEVIDEQYRIGKAVYHLLPVTVEYQGSTFLLEKNRPMRTHNRSVKIRRINKVIKDG